MKENIVIVLDPGHGGQNEGLTYNGFVEKDMNLEVAKAMKDELLMYDHVQVFITNPDTVDMSLKQRAEYAKSVGADVLISLHFNMSEEHRMYGSEVWIPSRGVHNAQMHSLGDLFLDELGEEGFVLRGVKTRLNKDGNDYYGIIRESENLGMQSILLEHGYADVEGDALRLDTLKKRQNLGRRDAQAVAKYFGLKSQALGIDYSTYVKNGYMVPNEPVGSDLEGPKNAYLYVKEITKLQKEEKEGLESKEQTDAIDDLYSMTLEIGAQENESSIVYYDYSLDGGMTWSELFPFKANQKHMEITIDGISNRNKVVCRLFNSYFIDSQTNVLEFEGDDQSDAGEKGEGNSKGNSDVQSQKAYEIKEEKEEIQGQSQTVYKEKDGINAQTQTGNALSWIVSIICLIGIIISAFCFIRVKKSWNNIWNKRRYSTHVRNKQIGAICITIICAIIFFTFGIGKNIFRPASSQTSRNEQQSINEDGLKEDYENEVNDIKEKRPLTLTRECKAQQKKIKIVDDPEEETTIIYDIFYGYLRVPLIKGIDRNPYDLEKFYGSNLTKNYSDDNIQNTMIGIDVSKFQGNIDWQSVSESGVQFAILRMGFRGYESGALITDEKFYDNVRGAKENNIQTGLYFFSAAATPKEAEEEAEYVLSAISGLDISMPIVFDTEPIYSENSRIKDVSPKELTRITKAFCNKIRQAGYRPMIYANAKRLTTALYLKELQDYEIWLADYRETPDYPYDFSMWQFTESGSVPGVSGSCDIDLLLVP